MTAAITPRLVSEEKSKGCVQVGISPSEMPSRVPEHVREPVGVARIVRETLEACLPEGVPPSFRSIDQARAIGRGKHRQIVARLTMFDGLRATVRLRQWAMGWTHKFSRMEGGALAWEDGAWRRVDQCA